MNLFDVVGILAGVMTIAIYIPQAWRVFRHRHDAHALRGMSILGIGASVVEFVLWIVWGFGRGVPIGAVPYVVLLPFVVTTFVLVVRAHRHERRTEERVNEPAAAD